MIIEKTRVHESEILPLLRCIPKPYHDLAKIIFDLKGEGYVKRLAQMDPRNRNFAAVDLRIELKQELFPVNVALTSLLLALELSNADTSRGRRNRELAATFITANNHRLLSRDASVSVNAQAGKLRSGVGRAGSTHYSVLEAQFQPTTRVVEFANTQRIIVGQDCIILVQKA